MFCEPQTAPTSGWTRREFLWCSALAGGALAVAPRLLAAAPPLSVGVVGLGDRGLPLAAWCRQSDGLTLGAVCDLRPAAVAAASRPAKGAPPATSSDFRQLAGDRRLDALLLALPAAAVEEVALAAVGAGKHLLLAPPVPRRLVVGRLADLAAAQGRLVALLPRSRYAAPTPWLAAAEAPPRTAALRVGLPPLDGEATARRLLSEVADDFDFLRTVTGASDSRLLDASVLAGPVAGRRFEVRAGLRFDVAGKPVVIDLRIVVDAHVTKRRSQAIVAAAGRQVRLAGEGLRWDAEFADAELSRFAFAVRERDARYLTLPLDAASVTARLLDEVAARVDVSGLSGNKRS